MKLKLYIIELETSKTRVSIPNHNWYKEEQQDTDDKEKDKEKGSILDLSRYINLKISKVVYLKERSLRALIIITWSMLWYKLRFLTQFTGKGKT